MKKHLPRYSQNLIPVARKLRREMSDAEKKHWSVLRGKQLGSKFRRQVPFGKYVLDFYCHEEKLDIELDGSQHYTEEGKACDTIRDQRLQEQGIEVVRFSNLEVLQNIDSVMDVIMGMLAKRLQEKKTPS